MNPPAGEGQNLPAPAEEEALLTLVRLRAQDVTAPRRILWERAGRCAEREDLRARLGLSRAEFDLLPSGRPWRGRVVKGRWFRRTVSGLSIGFAPSWAGLAEGGGGAITVAQAVDFFATERAAWRRRFGSRPFHAAVAGVFAEQVEGSPLPNLALISREGDEWRYHQAPDAPPELARLFFPCTPGECAARVEAHLDRSAAFPRLLSAVANELRLPAEILVQACGKILPRYALEYHSGHYLFYRR